ncbi:hypothetical protein EW145_g2344 [Phellinidium pouzarii]|uniref:SUZ domain-containing protein n=1 Tax=Phellinidium pouzarii TaxID=167371 RepID=A0A4S4LBR6_9AGAM|nr:hypothetical protein EW145_g2344 [Phellinidium pouzarii]
MSSTDNTTTSIPNKQFELDPWEQSSSSIDAFAPHNARSISSKAKAKPVPDDWDNDEDDEDEEEVDNAAVWRNADSKTPMPEVVLGTSTSSVAPLPPSAFQAPLRILKRPTSSFNGNGPSMISDAYSQKSLKDREAAYQAARARIFGEAASPSPAVIAADSDSAAHPLGSNSSAGDLPAPSAPPALDICAMQARAKMPNVTKTLKSKAGERTSESRSLPPSLTPPGVLCNPRGPVAPASGKQAVDGIPKSFTDVNGGGTRKGATLPLTFD